MLCGYDDAGLLTLRAMYDLQVLYPCNTVYDIHLCDDLKADSATHIHNPIEW